MKKTRVDKQKKLIKVTEELIKNPLATTREIEERTGVSRSTVSNYMRSDLDKVWQKSQNIQDLLEIDFACIQLWVNEIKRRLEDKEELKNMRAYEISQVIKDNTARYTLFKGNATDKDWGMNAPVLDNSQLATIANRILLSSNITTDEWDNDSSTTTE